MPTIRPGFTLAELLVGLFLLTAGLIGTAGTAAVLTYHSARAGRAEHATRLAAARMAALRAAGCTASGGSVTDGPFTIAWSVRPGPYSARAEVVVRFTERDRPRTDGYVLGFLC